jgi:pyruvate/2-oxoglutarate dehydrogenase complex dihydrolipoamide acyltransferase (E2) component
VAYEFKLPDLGEGLTEGEIARWLVAEGQEIAEDDPLVEIQTDKTTVEIPSPAAGVVSRILAAEGDVVPVGNVIVVIGGEPGAPAEASEPRAESVAQRPSEASNTVLQAPERVRTTPLVRRVAQELGVDLAGIAPSGPGGRITEDDVRAAAGGARSSPSLAPPGERREPLRGVRRLIAEHMTRAQSIPAVTWVEECDFGNVDLGRLVPTVLHAVAASLQEFPELNARLEGDEIVYLERCDLGVAIDTDQGLVVPVVRGCDSLSLDELDAEVHRLADGARAGTLKPEELRGSTFSVTSAGKFSGAFVTPLINHPEAGILGIHRIAERAVVRDGEVVARPVGHVSVTFDHRVLDGKRAAEFGLDVISRLERRGPG